MTKPKPPATKRGLLPCPFCGARARYDWSGNVDEVKTYYVRCQNDWFEAEADEGVCGASSMFDAPKKFIREWWNRRAK